LPIWQKFPGISDTKMKEEIFIGPQITQLFEDQYFSTKLNSMEGRAWKAFENIFRNFLGKEKAKNFREIVQELISWHSAIETSFSAFHCGFFS
jgi:hypothetical protein